VAAFMLIFQGVSGSQEVSPLRLKAFLIWNIAKFTKWPAGTIRADEPFTVCVVGNAVVADALQDTANERTLTGHRVVVRHSRPIGPPPSGCHVLFVSGGTPAQLAEILNDVRDRPVLSITDIEGSAHSGVIVQFVYEGSQLAYRLQLDSAKRAGVEITGAVLRFAKSRP
jgi:hypothetical protein